MIWVRFGCYYLVIKGVVSSNCMECYLESYYWRFMRIYFYAQVVLLTWSIIYFLHKYMCICVCTCAYVSVCVYVFIDPGSAWYIINFLFDIHSIGLALVTLYFQWRDCGSYCPNAHVTKAILIRNILKIMLKLFSSFMSYLLVCKSLGYGHAGAAPSRKALIKWISLCTYFLN